MSIPARAPFGGHTGKVAVDIERIDMDLHRRQALEAKEAVLATLAQLHAERHPHLFQYVATVVSPTGLTLREAAAAMGLSFQRVAQLRDKGLAQMNGAQISKGPKFDLSWWPMPAPTPPRPTRHRLESDVVDQLRALNQVAKSYRPPADPAEAWKFYQLVEKLHESGVSYAGLARLLGEKHRTFLRRLSRWGVTQGTYGGAGKVVPAVKREKRRARWEREKDDARTRAALDAIEERMSREEEGNG